MAASTVGERETSRLQVVDSVKTPLAFFVLSLLVVEGLLAALLVNASGTERTIAIIGMLVLVLGAGVAVFFLAYYRPDTVGLADVANRPTKLEFDQIIRNLLHPRSAGERHSSRRPIPRSGRWVSPRGRPVLCPSLRFQRCADRKNRAHLLRQPDGVGQARGALRVRYFMGPYNDEIITRAFPLRGPKQGVAPEAIESGEIQIRNSMESELKERVEARLRAMMSVPVPRGAGERLEDGAITTINIDSVVEGVFPNAGSSEFVPVQKRARDLGDCVKRVAQLRKSAVAAIGSR